MSYTSEGREARIQIGRLWARESKGGRRYYVARLGSVRLLAFEGSSESDAWLDLVAVADQRERPTPTEALERSPGEPSEARQRVLRSAAHPRSAFAAPPPADDGDPIPF